MRSLLDGEHGEMKALENLAAVLEFDRPKDGPRPQADRGSQGSQASLRSMDELAMAAEHVSVVRPFSAGEETEDELHEQERTALNSSGSGLGLRQEGLSMYDGLDIDDDTMRRVMSWVESVVPTSVNANVAADRELEGRPAPLPPLNAARARSPSLPTLAESDRDHKTDVDAQPIASSSSSRSEAGCAGSTLEIGRGARGAGASTPTIPSLNLSSRGLSTPTKHERARAESKGLGKSLWKKLRAKIQVTRDANELLATDAQEPKPKKEKNRKGSADLGSAEDPAEESTGLPYLLASKSARSARQYRERRKVSIQSDHSSDAAAAAAAAAWGLQDIDPSRSVEATVFESGLGAEARALLVKLITRRVATSTPAVLVFEDMHLADSASWLALAALVQRVGATAAPQRRIAVLVTCRPLAADSPAERAAASLVSNPAALHVDLGPLPMESAEALLCAALKTQRVPRTLLEFLYNQGEAMPSPMAALAFALVDDGTIEARKNIIYINLLLRFVF
eukprot:tig00020564_g11453.t1